MTFHKSGPVPELLDGTRFCKPETLLLDGFRLWSQNADNMTYIRRKFVGALGAQAGERATKALKMLSYLIGIHAHRTFLMYHPGSPKATADERWLLALVGAVLHRERSRAVAMVTYMLPYSCHGTVLAVAGELGRSLSGAGYEIPRPRKSAALVQSGAEIRAVA